MGMNWMEMWLKSESEGPCAQQWLRPSSFCGYV